ncbi:hypothetical protein NA57DRAFT_74249 [Rhizodiscina lignyota]|uniref:Cytochrome c oxidase subunit 8, mitochondrial n=1 Tax=Rhizodiscina lignyota TaxID=1504668 RepID=A0A9P4IGM9_9PEZI|nr:hypothetical protein NA57DRAFT_74249 [Rhizodiscina lignyota]
MAWRVSLSRFGKFRNLSLAESSLEWLHYLFHHELLPSDLLLRPSTSTQDSRSIPANMLARPAIRASAASSQIARRGFHTTRAQFASPYHYPEGPRSNIPFNPLTKYFFLRYWGFCAVGFGLPFGVAFWQTHKGF